MTFYRFERPAYRTGFACGTRATVKAGPFDYRACCATCDKSGASYETATEANRAVMRDSAKPCSCGAR
jgi:hypothetical protein